MKIIPETCRAH